jgi:predicted DNA-binding transcriptional regulator AlpA
MLSNKQQPRLIPVEDVLQIINILTGSSDVLSIENTIQKNPLSIINNHSSERKRLNHSETALALGISEPTLYKWRKEGLVPSYQIKPKSPIFYDLTEIEEILRKNPLLQKYIK